MEKEFQNTTSTQERRLSYCEIHASEPGNPRLGAGSPADVLSLPDDGTSIRFFMLDPFESESCPWRARWSHGHIDDTGKITMAPWVHPSQAEGAWARFFIQLIPRMSRIAHCILDLQAHEEPAGREPIWIRLRFRDMAVSRCPKRPTPTSILEDSSEPEWSPVYIRLLGSPAELGHMLESLSRDYDLAPRPEGPGA